MLNARLTNHILELFNLQLMPLHVDDMSSCHDNFAHALFEDNFDVEILMGSVCAKIGLTSTACFHSPFGCKKPCWQYLQQDGWVSARLTELYHVPFSTCI